MFSGVAEYFKGLVSTRDSKSSGIGMGAKYIQALVSPLSNLLTGISMVAMVFVMLLVVADVFMRSVFNAPIRGTHDLTILAFALIVFLPMSIAALKDRHVSLLIAVERLPRVGRLVIESVMMLAVTGVLGIVTWRLLLQGQRLQATNAETALLGIPTPPFLYLATFAFALMTLVFLARVLEALSKIPGER